MICHRRTTSMKHGVEELTLRLNTNIWTEEETDYLVQVLAYVLERSHDMKEQVGSILCEKDCACQKTRLH